MEPTDIQRDIIANPGNTVVLASPGSGKTFIMSEKIRKVFEGGELLDYQGVIALSYTRKASANLKRRTLIKGTNSGGSYFGTIDSFCLTQIVLPFGKYVFGNSVREVAPLFIQDLNEDRQIDFEWIDMIHPEYESINTAAWDNLKQLYTDGYVLVESLELLALHIIRQSIACRRYLSARYRYIFIDEYQDADCYTDGVFRELIAMGMIGVAVGDANQSIFGFSHKVSKYLTNLQLDPSFTYYALNENHRCSVPIINYSNRLLDKNSTILPTDKDGVYLMHVDGAEERAAEVISACVSELCNQHCVRNLSDIAVLVRNSRTLQILDESLTIPHRVLETTILEMDMNIRSRLYSQLLTYYFDSKMPFLQVIDEYEDYGNLPSSIRQRLLELEHKVKEVPEDNVTLLCELFEAIANMLLPHTKDSGSNAKLETVLANEKLYNTYRPLNDNEIVLMTLHKSKGLEFEVVFHMNLNEWELPYQKVENGDFNNPIYYNFEQDLNLHYVGITRAKSQCFLITTSYRTNNNGETKRSKPSVLLNMNRLQSLRREYNV